MRNVENHWETPDGFRLFTRTWMPETQPESVILLVHGLGEHTGRYEHVAEFFTKAGAVLIGFDQRGHGKSSGPKGYIPSYETSMKDIRYFVEQAHADFPNLPFFLYGHSMGGAMVLYFGLTQKENLTGIICTSPGLKPANKVSKFQLTSAKILSKAAPKFALNNGLDVNGLARDPEIIEAYKNDPLVHPFISTSLAVDMIEKGDWMTTESGSFPYPLLLMHGTSDRLVDTEMITLFAKRHPQNLTHKIYDGLYHELHNEPEKNDILATMLLWMKNIQSNAPSLTKVT